mmetsp:Transcript_44222/g.137127  ORF Transcript_44222/g.137127 Transcript_44222/m.137127 type:complete len:326 (+) Transcript_44222:622-1599(+)
MQQWHLALHTAVPAELEAALARDVVALLGGLVAAGVGAAPRARLPAQGEGAAPGLVLVALGLLLPAAPVQLLLALLAGGARVRPLVAVAAEAVAARAGEVRVVVAVVQEDPLLAAHVLALEDMRVVAREELQQLVVRALGEALLEDVYGLLGPEVVPTALCGAGELAQPALANDDAKVVLQALKAETVLARQSAAALDLMLDKADSAPEHGPVLLALALQLVYESPVLVVDVPDALLGRGQVLGTHNATEVRLAQVLRAAGHLGGATDVRQAAERHHLLRPEALEARNVDLVAAVQRLEHTVLAEADDTGHAQGGTQVTGLRNAP